MSILNHDDSPELSGQRTITGMEPELPNQRKCPACGSPMKPDLFGNLRCQTCKVAQSKATVTKARLEGDPVWFTAGKTTPVKHIQNVRAGRHPMGFAMQDDPQKTCGNCAWLRRLRYHDQQYPKCRLTILTHGPASDIRVGWQGCIEWNERDGEVEQIQFVTTPIESQEAE